MFSWRIERGYGQGRTRVDISFSEDVEHFLELKIYTSSYSVEGVERKVKRTTDINKDIQRDVERLRRRNGSWFICFLIYPISQGISDWKGVIARLGEQIGINISDEEHCVELEVPLKGNRSSGLVICCFEVPHRVLSGS